MSFIDYKDTISENDKVIIFVGYDNMHILKIEVGKIHQTKFGALSHDSLIGKPYGSKIQCSKGYLYVLQPTPELWSLTLPHRTQIIYSTDISTIVYQLDLKSGSVVVESGTGSGSLSHSLIRTISPDGHLYTFDFHEKRVEQALQEFIEHKIDDLVTIKQRDVLKTGFGLDRIANAVFLDLPTPWPAIVFAKDCLKSEGRICSFSPCIEQVQKTCEVLNENGFQDIKTLECLQLPYDSRTVNMPVADIEDELEVIPVVGEITKNDKKRSYIFKSSPPVHTVAGHTGYLTFATYYCLNTITS